MSLLLAAALLAASGGQASGKEYHWPNVRGLVGQYGISNLTGPRNLSNPSWRWHHPKGQYWDVVVGGPVIDDEKNLYFASMTMLVKMSPTGETIWSTKPMPPGVFPDGPSIHNGAVFVTTTTGKLCKYRMDSGAMQWCEKYAAETGGDSKYVTSHDGVVIIGTDNARQQGGGSRMVVGVDADSGKKIWDFRPDTPTWNNMGIFTEDDTVVLQDWDAQVYRLGLHNGSLLWKSGGSKGRTWSDGGTIIGANGVVYAVAAKYHQIAASIPGAGGVVSAYSLSDGELLWSRETRDGIYTWPVAGQLHKDKRWTVVIASGAIPPCSPQRQKWLMGVAEHILDVGKLIFYWLLLEVAVMCLFRRKSWASRCCWAFARLLLLPFVIVGLISAGVWHWKTYQVPKYVSEITAYDAETGSVVWKYELPVWHYPSARGDDEGYFTRLSTPWRGLCCPASFGSPSVDSNGVVYIGHESGVFYAIKDANENGWIEASEVRAFDAEAAFLHSGPAFAPGMFAFSTCDSVWVWND